MGEILIKKIFLSLFFAVVAIISSSIVLAVAHTSYPAFSTASNGFLFNNVSNTVSINDTIIYRMGYYSINGSAWVQFNFSGVSYYNNSNWMQNSVVKSLPSFGYGEHYIISYSCTYLSVNNTWDCHGEKWQLLIINESSSNATANTANCTCSSHGFNCGNQTICASNIDCGTCSTGYSCAQGTCVVSCAANSYSSCYNGDVYWYDSCGVKGGIRYDCSSSQTCSNGVCVNSQSSNLRYTDL
jgi:hypothetical protein